MTENEERMEEFKGRIKAAREWRPDHPRADYIEIITIADNEHALVMRYGKRGQRGAVLAVIRGNQATADYVRNALETVELFMPDKIVKTKEEIAKKPKPDGPLIKEAEKAKDK